MAAEVRMVLYEDDSVQVQYVDGSRLQLSPCGSEFLFEKAPPVSAHPLEQPERLRQRTHFVISTYREQLQRALDFRNSFAVCPFLSESIIPSKRRKRIFVDFSEARWPSPDTDDGVICTQSGSVKIASLDGHAYLCLPRSQHEFTVHFLCKVSQKPDSSIVLSEKKNQARKAKLVEKAGKICTYGSLSRQRLKNKENELYCQITKSKESLEKKSCVDGAEGEEEPPPPGTGHTCVYTWVKQRWPVASCPEEWKYPLSLARLFHNKISSVSRIDADTTQSRTLTSEISEERGKEVSVLPRALLLSCPVPHLHRWNFCDSLSQGQLAEEYSYPELVKVVWYKGVTYRLNHKNVNSIEIYPGDGSVFKSEGANLGRYFTYYSIQEGSEEREEKTYSVNNLPPDRPGSLFSVCSLIRQATRILQHCAKTRLSLSHNYRICCWKMVPGINDSNTLPLLLRESLIHNVGRFLAYSDDKAHALFLDGITLTLHWNFSSLIEKRQVNQGLNLGWCKLTFPDGQDQLIQIEHPGPYERYVTAVISWCRRLTQTSQREMPTYPSSSVVEENWSVASELEKIKKFNCSIINGSSINGNFQYIDLSPPSLNVFLVHTDGASEMASEAEKTHALLQSCSTESLISSLGLGIFCLVADRLLQFSIIQQNDWLRALSDNAVHCVIGMWLWAIVIGVKKTTDFGEIVLAGFLASVIDVDHFFLAGSLSLKAALTLPRRPFLHCSTVIPVVVVTLKFTMHLFKLKDSWCFLPWMLFISWTSHHIRDGIRHGLWICPFGKTSPLPFWLYVVITSSLPHICSFVMYFTGTRQMMSSKHGIHIDV